MRAGDNQATLSSESYVTVDDGRRFDGVEGRYVELRVRLKGTCPGVDFVTPAICNLIVHQGLGDMNCDGITNSYDIDGFICAISPLCDYEGLYPDCDRRLGDCNSDGIVNSYDIDAFIALVGCPSS